MTTVRKIVKAAWSDESYESDDLLDGQTIFVPVDDDDSDPYPDKDGPDKDDVGYEGYSG